MAEKRTIVSGRKVITTAGTAERLVSASSRTSKLRGVIFGVDGDEAAILGDSGVLYAAATRNGWPVGDATGAAGTTQTVTWNVDDGGRGLKFVGGEGCVDLYDVWADVETSGDAVFWFGYY